MARHADMAMTVMKEEGHTHRSLENTMQGHTWKQQHGSRGRGSRRKVDKSLYCSFCGGDGQRRVSRLRIG